MTIWYILRPLGIFVVHFCGIFFPVLEYCTKKNLATLFSEIKLSKSNAAKKRELHCLRGPGDLRCLSCIPKVTNTNICNLHLLHMYL
jgi:hypothetical protein